MLILVMMFALLSGFVLGMIVVHILDERNMKANPVIEETKEEEHIEDTSEKENVVNFYFPKRNIKTGDIPRNSYIPENFTIEDGFVAYYDENGNKISHVGVDLSYYNLSVDWDKLAASPVEFVMLRCGYRGYTEGGLVEDEKFREFATAANEHGIAMGVYFFTQAINEQEAISEAEYVIKLIENYDISYPVAIDTEYVSNEDARTNTAELTKEELSNICIAFCERIKEEGYYPMIYASENWFRRKLDVGMLNEYDFWAPQYLDENDFLFDHTIWQYTESGSAPGVEGECDLNVSMVDYEKFVPGLRQAVLTNGEVSEYSHESPQITVTPIDNNVNTGEE